ncbi:MAG: hypothetical protein IRY89_02315 [Pseudolabrys sp.]|nr:hypothetical protein [Pseudolabrys sp.]
MRRSIETVLWLGLAGVVAGCSEYLDHRDTITLNGGNAVATNVVTQMVDPWPRASANRNIAFNGEVMEGAMLRYRTHRVIPPRGTSTSSSYKQEEGTSPGTDSGTVQPLGPTPSQQVK